MTHFPSIIRAGSEEDKGGRRGNEEGPGEPGGSLVTYRLFQLDSNRTRRTLPQSVACCNYLQGVRSALHEAVHRSPRKTHQGGQSVLVHTGLHMLVFRIHHRGPWELVQVRHTEQRDAARRGGDLRRREHLLVGVSLPDNPVQIDDLHSCHSLCAVHADIKLHAGHNSPTDRSIDNT